MVKKTFFKSCLRSVRGSFSRFLAIFAIVALGSGFLAGLLATTPDMRHTASEYYKTAGLYDLRIAGSLGLEQGDADAVAGVPGIAAVMLARFLDREVLLESGDTVVARMHGVSDFPGTGEAVLNRPALLSGRWPENDRECVVEQEFGLSGSLLEGSVLRIVTDEGEQEEDLSCSEYTIVGTVRSAYYISMVQRGSTTMGSGSIGIIVYIPDNCFLTDYYTDLYAAVEGADKTEAYSAAYDALVEPVQGAVKVLAETRKHVRADAVRQEAQEALNDAKQELAEKTAEGQQELDDALRELEDGEQDYADGLKKWEDGKKDLASALKKLRDGEKELPDALRELEDGERELQDARRELDDGWKEYEDGVKELEEKQAELDDAAAKIRDGKQELKDALRTLEKGEKASAEGRARIAENRKQLEDGQKQLDAARTQLETQASQAELAYQYGMLSEEAYKAAMAQIAAGRRELNTQQAQITAGLQALDAAEKELSSGTKQLNRGWEDYDAGKKELDDAEAQWRSGAALLADGKQQLDDARKKLEDGEKDYQDGLQKLADGRKEYEDGKQALADGRIEYENGKKDLLKAEEELTDARKKLDDGWKEYEDGRQEFDDGIADANQKIREAEDDIAAIDDPEWFVMTRGESNEGYIYYESDTEKVAAIAKVFPVFFFLVAALVASTTMTRMIDEDRGSIGTLKALGYGGGAIAGKYLFYAAAACLCGSVFGLSLGLYFFPRVLANAYRMMYDLPDIIASDHLGFILLSAGLITLAVLLATLNALRESLRNCSAELMRPKAPPAGKRIFLEHIKPIWSRMSFTHKVTARNLFRYKKRFIMTIIGITGCTALLLTGFGLRDSISDIVALQFGELQTYNMTLTLKHEGDDTADRRIRSVLSDESRVTDRMLVHMETGEGISGQRESDLRIVVPDRDEQLADFFLFRDRLTHEPVSFTQNGAILTEKAAKVLGIEAGDRLRLRNQDDVEGEIPVTGICENYVYGYIYIPREVYESAFGQECVFDTVLAKMNEPTKERRDAAAEELLRSSNATGISFSNSIMETFSDMLASIDYIVVVLIIAAAALAFVVLYNLTNINICERQKEIATIKVLGFRPGEVSSYIYRETILLSLIGTAIGLIGGIFLHQFVVQTAEVDAVMFGRVIKPMSYVFSAAMTLLFTLLVNLVMSRKLRRIDMVESLKAPE